MESGILFTIIGVVEGVLTAVVTFLLTRRKYSAEVKGNEIDNDGHKIENEHRDLDFYIKMTKDNKVKLNELSDENMDLRRQVAEMRSIVLGMLQQICTDMMCQNRKFDAQSCPYYNNIFKTNKQQEETDYEPEI